MHIPALAVLGNHNFESGEATLISNVLDQASVIMLDGSAHDMNGIGFADVCGFAGGFGRRMLNAWGEPLIKQFAQEAIDCAVRLKQALSKLQTEKKIVVLHYSPIRATVQGEDSEILPFLGSSRLDEPINRFRVSAVFHGHAHNGTKDGMTSTGRPGLQCFRAIVKKIRTHDVALSSHRNLNRAVCVTSASNYEQCAQLRYIRSVSVFVST